MKINRFAGATPLYTVTQTFWNLVVVYMSEMIIAVHTIKLGVVAVQGMNLSLTFLETEVHFSEIRNLRIGACKPTECVNSFKYIFCYFD